MLLFFILSAAAMVLQIYILVLLTLLGTKDHSIDSFFEVLLTVYKPFIILVASAFEFRGESAMIEPVWMGVSLGVIVYAILFGLVGQLLFRLFFRKKTS